MIFTESVRCATSLADRGDFYAAIDALGDRWPGLGVEPGRNSESDLEYAELLLICGVLTVEIGRFRLAPVQSNGKDLLSKAVRLFGDGERKYMAMFWLSSAYLWCGENQETLTLVDSVLDDQTADSEVVFRSSLLKSLAHLNLGNFTQAEDALSSVEVLIETVSPMVRGRFYLNRGMLFRQTGRLNEAIADHEKAIEMFTSADSSRFQAAARNNISVALTELCRFAEARSAAESALRVFTDIGDLGHQAKVWDQIARIYEREENYVDMVRCSDRAVEILSAGDHEGWLAEALITQGSARARLGLAEANVALSRALEICELQGDPKQAAAATKAMWEIVQRGRETRDGMRAAVLPLERAVYKQVLEMHHGHVSPAARDLGLHHQVLQKRLTTRFPDLLAKRTPAIRRHKALIKT